MKLRLPSKLVAAIMAAASPVLLQTLSTATLGVAAVAAVAGHQAMGEEVPISSTTNWLWSNEDHAGDTVNISGSNVTLGLNNGSGNGAGNAQARAEVNAASSIIVGEGSMLSVWAWTAGVRSTSTEDKVTLNSNITLNNGATLKSQDGSYVFAGDITVNGTAQFLSEWNKGYIMHSLKGNDDAVLRLTRGTSDNNTTWLVLDQANTFAGTIKMDVPADMQDYYLILTNSNALQHAAVNTGSSANNRLTLGVQTNNIRALSGSGLVSRHSSGLGNVTLNVTGDTNGVFSGTLDSNITLNLAEEAKQSLENATLTGNVTNTSGGELTLSGTAFGGSGTITSSKTRISGPVDLGSGRAVLSGSISVSDNTLASYQVADADAEGYTYSAGQNGYRRWESTYVALLRAASVTGSDIDFGELSGIVTSTYVGALKQNVQSVDYYVNTTDVETSVANAQHYLVATGGKLNINANNTSIDSVTLTEGSILNTRNGNGSNMTGLTISTLTVDGPASLTKQDTWSTQLAVAKLSGTGNLLVNFGTDNNSNPSYLKLTGAGDYSGKLTFSSEYKTSDNYWGRSYCSFVEISNQNALSSAVLNLNGTRGHKRGGSDYDNIVSLALNVGTVNLAGLEGNEYSYIYSGSAIATTTNDRPASQNTKRTLSISTAQGTEYTYSGTIGTNVNLAMNGSGTQIFDGDMSSFNGSITNNGGSLVLRGSGGMTISSITSIGGSITFGDTVNHTPFTATISGEWALGTSGGRTTNITIAEGATINAGTVKAAWGFSAFKVDGVLNANNINLSTGPQQYNISGNGTVNTNTFTFGNVGYYTISVNRINIGSGGITNGGWGRTLDGTTLGATADWIDDPDLTLTNTVTFDTSNAETTENDGTGHTITLKGVLSGTGSLVKEGVGTLKLNGANTFTGSLTANAGTLQINNTNSTRTLTVSADAALEITQNGALTLTSADFGSTVTNNGSLNLNGATVHINRDLNRDVATFSKGDYGYLQNAAVTIIEGSGTTQTNENTTWNLKLGGMTAEQLGFGTTSFANGTLTMSNLSEEGSKRWFMNTGEGGDFIYTGAPDQEDQQMTSILINAKTDAEGNTPTLHLNTQGAPVTLTEIKVNNTTANIEIAQDAQLNKGTLTFINNGSAVLTGSGAYKLASGEQTLGDGVSMHDTAWKGRVVLSGAISYMRLDTNILGTANSYVEFDGVTGFFGTDDKINTTVASNVIIGEGGILFDNGYSKGTTTFTGTLSGTGDMTRGERSTNTTKLAFSGDVSKYTGSFIHNRTNNDVGFDISFSGAANEINANFKTGEAAAGTMTVTFGAADTIVNGIIDNRSGWSNLNQKINLVSNANNVTFTNDVWANKLTINNGKTATFNAAEGKTQSIGSLAGSGTLKVTGTAATETEPAKGGLLIVTGDSDNFTGGVTLGNTNMTAAADTVGLVVQNSTALSGSVVNFESGNFGFGTTNTSSLLAFRNAEGEAINGSVAGLNGNRGKVVADTLTINVNVADSPSRDPYAFQNRYDTIGSPDSTNDAAVLEVNKLVKTGVGTQIIGGEYTEGDGLVIDNGIEVQQGTLHMKTRGKVTADIKVAAGATFQTSDDEHMADTADAAMHYNGKLTLNGTATNTATLFYADGSTYIADGLEVNGYGKVVMNNDTTQFIGGLNSAGETPSVLTLERNAKSQEYQNTSPRYIVVNNAGNFNGTIKMNNKAANNAFGIVAAGEGAQNALAGAVVDFTDSTNNAIVAFVENSSMKAPGSEDFISNFQTYEENYLNSTNLLNGSVAGLVGTKGAVYANNLTINTADGAKYTYGGALNVSGVIQTGAGTQTLSGDMSNFNGALTATDGTLAISGKKKVNTSGIHANGGTIASVGGATISIDCMTANNQFTIGSSGSISVEQGGKFELANWWSFTMEALGTSPATMTAGATSEADANFAFNRTDITISDAKVSYTANADATVANKFTNSVVVKTGTGTLTVTNAENTLVGVHAEKGNVVVTQTNSSARTLKSVKADGGNVTLQNLTAATGLSLSELVIGDSKTVSALTDDQTHVNGGANVATVAIENKGVLKAGNNSTLNANLVMASGSTLGVGDSGLQLGCSLTLNQGAYLNEEDGTLDSVRNTGYDTRWLYTSVDSLTLVDTDGAVLNSGMSAADQAKAMVLINQVDASTYFSNLTKGVYFMTVQANSNGGWDLGVTAPEPSTSVLSLLALAGMAARRRRK